MPAANAPKYTKDDFLDYRKLAEKFGLDPMEVYKVLHKHWKANTPIKYKSGNNTITSKMIIAKTPTKADKIRTSTSNRHALLLHPMGIERLLEDLNKGK